MWLDIFSLTGEVRCSFSLCSLTGEVWGFYAITLLFFVLTGTATVLLY